jgi:hypothetical protein
MQPSLTPHQDAVRRLAERDTRTFTDPAEAAVSRTLRAAEMELAGLLDAGAPDDRVLGFCAAVSASLMDTVASSASIANVGGQPDPGQRAEFLRIMLSQVCDHLSGNDPSYQASEAVATAPAGRA